MTTELIDIAGELCLQHHGVLGMKWGVRKYQNKDGTLKPKGRNRLKEKIESEIDKRQRGSSKYQPTVKDSKGIVRRKVKGKYLKTMSDADLNRSNERLRRENEYKRLQTRIKQGESFAMSLVKGSVRPIATMVLTAGTIYGGQKIINKYGTQAMQDFAQQAGNTMLERIIGKKKD